ncbi:MAG: hypothetical protein RBS72_11480 [Sedimentisphaerales bacterium]|jgi:hypothetical protein|nr:hypothetical protein [Sedimentisphaerales bacterium]NLX23265.1 hypothetical protein [Phycisphaerae bacterium]HNY78212.1 hypothetical protein [Sedimentisphaerales bacterium]HOC65363.1 hypothetical protein [Sedimentisphaerales bacterium]HOH63250.1 hypothetical protein [Sedimentisphaerales bacterium]
MSRNDAEATPRSDAKARWPWYIWDIVLFGGFVVLCLALFGVPSALFYLQARRDGSASWDAIAAFMGLALLGLVWLCVLGVRMYISWPKHVEGFWRLLLAWAIVIVGVVLLVAVSFEVWPPLGRFQMSGFRRYIQRQADIPAMQTWLDTVDPNVCDEERIAVGTDVHGVPIPLPSEVDLPSSVLDLKPRYVQLSLDETNRPMVCLEWGSGLEGTWGLTVGRKDMPILGTQRPTKTLLRGDQVRRCYDEDRLPIADGAYIWHELE